MNERNGRSIALRVVDPADVSFERSAGETIILEITIHPLEVDGGQLRTDSPSTTAAGTILLRVEEAAKELAISRAALYPLLGREIPVVRIGRAVRIPRQALVEYVNRSLDRA